MSNLARLLMAEPEPFLKMVDDPDREMYLDGEGTLMLIPQADFFSPTGLRTHLGRSIMSSLRFLCDQAARMGIEKRGQDLVVATLGRANSTPAADGRYGSLVAEWLGRARITTSFLALALDLPARAYLHGETSDNNLPLRRIAEAREGLERHWPVVREILRQLGAEVEWE